MMADSETFAVQQIESLNRELQSAEKMLHNIRLTKKQDGKPDYRFYNVRPGNAAVILITERGHKMKKQELADLIIAGGYSWGVKKAVSNIRIAFEESVVSGKLIERGDYLDIPR